MATKVKKKKKSLFLFLLLLLLAENSCLNKSLNLVLIDHNAQVIFVNTY